MTDIFISYSHQDEQWKDALHKQLQVLTYADFTVWDDRQIKPGDGWLHDIETSIAAAKVAILLISPDFLISEFVRRQEIPKFLARRSEDGLRVIPLVVEPCPWQAVDWLASMQGATKDNAPLSRYVWDSYELKTELSQVALNVFYQLRDACEEEATWLESQLAERQQQINEQNRQEQLALEQAAEKQRAEQQRLKDEAEKAERLAREEKQRLQEEAETNARKAEEEQARFVEQQRQAEEAERLRQKQAAANKLRHEQTAREAQELERKREAENELRRNQAERDARKLAERQKAKLLHKQREAAERKDNIKGAVLATVSSGKGLAIAGVGLAAVVAGWSLFQESPVAEETVTKSVAIAVQKKEKLSFEPKMVNIEGGTFTMGCVDGRDNVVLGGCGSDEKPAHEVTVGAFKLAMTEVTVAQYSFCVAAKKCPKPAWQEKGSEYNIKTGTNDYYKNLGEALTNLDHPIVGVSWNDAIVFTKWLKEKTGKSYRLPTEAEWEYAARAGGEAAYSWGNIASHELANYGKNGCCAGFSSGKDKWVYTSPVGKFSANAFGLFDMHGNAWEWVDDAYGNYGIHRPKQASTSTFRVIRGGSWDGTPWSMRSAYRGRFIPEGRDYFVGFRLAQDQSSQ